MCLVMLPAGRCCALDAVLPVWVTAPSAACPGVAAAQAAELMGAWAPIDSADALGLLSPEFSNPEVRAHAVASLRATPDEELLYYLLPLVQARP